MLDSRKSILIAVVCLSVAIYSIFLFRDGIQIYSVFLFREGIQYILRVRQAVKAKPQGDQTAWIVRTYHGHGDGVRVFLKSLIAQHNTKWMAFLANTDNRPFPLLDTILQDLNDSRIIRVNDAAPTKFDYFDAGYSITDKTFEFAARHYPGVFRWLVFTNADNHYDPRFLDVLDPSADVISVNFFSRVDPFGLRSSAKYDHCFENHMRTGETDLGANIWNFQRWLSEKIHFLDFKPLDVDASKLALKAEQVKAVAQATAVEDGRVADHLLQSGWKRKSVGKCLFSHSPNAWECKNIYGGFFLNSPLREEVGCITVAEAISLASQSNIALLRQPGDLPNFANYLGHRYEAKFKESVTFEQAIHPILLSIMNNVSKSDSKNVAGKVRDPECSEPCFNTTIPGCSAHSAVSGRYIPCDCTEIYQNAESAGWTFDDDFYHDLGSKDLHRNRQPGSLLWHFKAFGCKEKRCARFTHPLRGELRYGLCSAPGVIDAAKAVPAQIQANQAAGLEAASNKARPEQSTSQQPTKPPELREVSMCPAKYPKCGTGGVGNCYIADCLPHCPSGESFKFAPANQIAAPDSASPRYNVIHGIDNGGTKCNTDNYEVVKAVRKQTSKTGKGHN